MPNRPARFTVADLVRATKAAEQAGPEWSVEIPPDGTIRLVRIRQVSVTALEPDEPREEIVL